MTHLKPLNPSVHWAQQHIQTKERVIDRRIRDFELLLLEHGLVEVQIGSRPPFTVKTGQFFLLPAKVKHRIVVKSEPEALFLGIHFDFYNELFITRDEDILVFEEPPLDDNFCSIPANDDFTSWLSMSNIDANEELYALMENIIIEFTQRPIGYTFTCQGLLLQLFGQIMRTIQQHERSKTSPGMQQAISELARYIEQEPGGDWSNERLAEMLNINIDYMGRLFKKCIGKSPNKFVQQVRHSEAKRLLRETDDKIESIGRTIGYRDVHYFARIFHKWEGMPPGEYRKFCRLL